MKPEIRRELDHIKSRLKRIENNLEIGAKVTSFDWANFSKLDEKILEVLLEKGSKGESTTKIAEILELANPEESGRVIVYRRLKRIHRISKKIKGFPIVIYDRKKWSLNFDEFRFRVEEKQELE